MDISILMWSLFWIILTVAFFIDLLVLNKHKNDIDIKSATTTTCIWIGLALFFGILIYFIFGYEKALEYTTGYIVEYSLSVDNIFAFLMVFTYFDISKNSQPKILLYGIIGAIILRFLFVFVGIYFVTACSWIVYVLGTILIYTAVKILFRKNKKKSIENSIVYKILKKLFRFKSNTATTSFFIKENGVVYATPIFATIIIIEMGDILFAIDSISAVLSISNDTFVIYTSNIFAIIGLRSLYFLLSNFTEKFKFLHTGIAVILFFIGFKMILSHFVHIPIIFSLAIIVIPLTISIAISYLYKCKCNLTNNS
jgi:tellurite resistance protein TerC